MFTYIIYSLVCVSLFYYINAICNFPPSLWCSSETIAIQCNVVEQCSKYQWSRRHTLSSSSSPSTSSSASDAVKVDFYFESMCPDCKRVFANQIFPAFLKLDASVMKLSVFPYGNANRKTGTNGSIEFTCQHGEEECLGNLIETCALSLYPFDKVMHFLDCVENSDSVPMKSSIQCSSKFGMDYADLMNCATSEKGRDLENKMAEATEKLVPTHTYVPWILINGEHNEDIQQHAENNLIKLVCDTYKGSPPAICIQALLPNRKCTKFNN